MDMISALRKTISELVTKNHELNVELKNRESSIEELSTSLYNSGAFVDKLRECRDLPAKEFKERVFIILDNLNMGMRGSNEHNSDKRPTRGS